MAVKAALHQGMFNEDEGLRRPSPLEAIDVKEVDFTKAWAQAL